MPSVGKSLAMARFEKRDFGTEERVPRIAEIADAHRTAEHEQRVHPRGRFGHGRAEIEPQDVRREPCALEGASHA